MSNIDKLQELLISQPDATQVIAVEFGNPDKVKAALLRLAHANGIAISDAELEQAMQSAQAAGALDDSQLDRIAGGISEGEAGVRRNRGMLLSVFTAGIACAMISLSAAVNKQNCNDLIERAAMGEIAGGWADKGK